MRLFSINFLVKIIHNEKNIENALEINEDIVYPYICSIISGLYN